MLHGKRKCILSLLVFFALHFWLTFMHSASSSWTLRLIFKISTFIAQNTFQHSPMLTTIVPSWFVIFALLPLSKESDIFHKWHSAHPPPLSTFGSATFLLSLLSFYPSKLTLSFSVIWFTSFSWWNAGSQINTGQGLQGRVANKHHLNLWVFLIRYTKF